VLLVHVVTHPDHDKDEADRGEHNRNHRLVLGLNRKLALFGLFALRVTLSTLRALFVLLALGFLSFVLFALFASVVVFRSEFGFVCCFDVGGCGTVVLAGSGAVLSTSGDSLVVVFWRAGPPALIVVVWVEVAVEVPVEVAEVVWVVVWVV